MKPKKNPKSDLRKRSLLFFQIGMVLVMFFIWRAIEWKTYEKDDLNLSYVDMMTLEEEIVPITELNIPPPPEPPPPLPAPDKLKVVEDEADIEEAIIESTETDQKEEVKVEDIKVAEIDDEIEPVPFEFIENVPVFPGCEGLSTNEERKKCMQDKINEYISKEFDTDLGSELGLSGINKIFIQFRIEKTGDVTVLGARGPHPRLEQEATEVIDGLPQMKPGRQRGQPVGVLYSLPIIFKVQD